MKMMIFALMLFGTFQAFAGEFIKVCNPLDKNEFVSFQIDKFKMTKVESIKTTAGYETKTSESMVLKILGLGESELMSYEPIALDFPKFVSGAAYYVKDATAFMVIAKDANGEKYLFQIQGGWKLLFGTTITCK